MNEPYLKGKDFFIVGLLYFILGEITTDSFLLIFGYIVAFYGVVLAFLEHKRYLLEKKIKDLD